jgi:hypothetical protein
MPFEGALVVVGVSPNITPLKLTPFSGRGAGDGREAVLQGSSAEYTGKAFVLAPKSWLGEANSEKEGGREVKSREGSGRSFCSARAATCSILTSEDYIMS